jgi:ribosomal protein L37AE/L43A
MIEFTSAVVIYCVAVAVGFAGLWLWYDRRDYRRFERERRRTTFHCIRCDALYSASFGTEVAKCPKCGHDNMRLRF